VRDRERLAAPGDNAGLAAIDHNDVIELLMHIDFVAARRLDAEAIAIGATTIKARQFSMSILRWKSPTIAGQRSNVYVLPRRS
jgi:hypothetical protein